MCTKRYRWWHGLAFYAGVQLGRYALRAAIGRKTTHKQDQRFYRSENLPGFAPPAAAFPVAWTINSVAAIAGGLHVINLPRSEARGRFLCWQAGSWVLFAAFEPLYFGLRSPINAALVTVAYTATTLASFRAALDLCDRHAAASLTPTIVWLGLANPLGIWQAFHNRDEFWKIN